MPIHCDIYIFEKLVRYLNEKIEPKLKTSNASAILRTAEFLGVDMIVEKCIVFISKHLEEIINAQEDLENLKPTLLERIAAKVSLV